MARAIFGDLGVSFFVAGAIFGDLRCRGGKNKLRERAGSVLQFHARIMVGSFSNRPPL